MHSRPERVADQIRQEVTTLLARSVHDPGIGFVTITRVKVTADLQLARIFYTAIGPEAGDQDKARKETAKALERAKPFLRRQVTQRIQLRRSPELEFLYDESIADLDKVERLLQEVREERRQYELANPEEAADAAPLPQGDGDGGERTARGEGAPQVSEPGGVQGSPPESAQRTERGVGPPRVSEPGGVQGSPPPKKDK